MQETPVRFLDWEDPLQKGQATHSGILGLPWWLIIKESACKEDDPSSIPGLGRSPGEGIGDPLHYCWVSLVAQVVQNPQETWVGKIS